MGIRNKFAVFFSTRNIFIIVNVNHMLYKTIFLELCGEVAVSFTAMDYAIFLHFPVEKFTIVKEKL